MYNTIHVHKVIPKIEFSMIQNISSYTIFASRGTRLTQLMCNFDIIACSRML